MDNRPQTFDEFLSITPQIVLRVGDAGPVRAHALGRASSSRSSARPGIIDPDVEVRETRNQIDDLMNEIRVRVDRDERVLVTTLTKKMSEDLTDYLLEMGFKVRYLHSEIDTLERIQIIRELRLGEYDILVGVNLLREGLDLPEVSLVAILDADKEGFLRGETSLIQTIGRAARNVGGKVLMYADKETAAMRTALDETDRRRAIQLAYNEEHGITPETIVKGISDISEFLMQEGKVPKSRRRRRKQRETDMTPAELESTIVELEEEMLAAAEDLRFEYAAKLRDEIRDLRRELDAATLRLSPRRPRGASVPAEGCDTRPFAGTQGAVGVASAHRGCLRWRPVDAEALTEWYERVKRAAAVARDPRPLRDPRQRGDAPADAGGARRARTTSAGWRRSRPRRRWRRPSRRTCCGCGAGSATTAGRWRCSARRRTSPRTAGPTTCTELPGVGPYTAAAVASFAFGADVATVDTNYRRVARRHGSRAAAEPADQPGDDGARRHGLHRPRAALRRLSGRRRSCARHPDPEPPPPRAASASRTPTATCAAGPWRRCWRAPRRRPAPSGCWTAWSATDWSYAEETGARRFPAGRMPLEHHDLRWRTLRGP